MSHPIRPPVRVLWPVLVTIGLLTACSATTGPDDEDVDPNGATDTGSQNDGANSDGSDDGRDDVGENNDGSDDVGENGDANHDVGENNDGRDDLGENNDGSGGDIGENGDVDGDSGDDLGEHSADADADMGPRIVCELSLHSLTQRNNNRCLTFPEDFQLLPGQHVVIARDATPSEFRSCYPDFPPVEDTDWRGGGAFFSNEAEGVYYLDSSAVVWAIDEGLPLFDGDETYEVRDDTCRDGDGFRGSGEDTIGTGDLIEDRTVAVPGSEFYNLARRIPIRSAGSNSAWQIEEEGGRLDSDIPTPGDFPEFEHPDLVISEVSHADSDEACSFVEISCPYLDLSELPSCCYPDEHGDFCAPVRDPAHCYATGGRDFYPVGAVCNPVCSDITDPIPECCVLFDEGPADDRCLQLNVVDCANAPGGGIPFARGQCALNLPCSEVDPPEPMCCIPGSPVGQCVSMERVECESINGTFMPLGGCDPADCPLEPPPYTECCVFGDSPGGDACMSLLPGEVCYGEIRAPGTCTEPCREIEITGACCRLEEEDCVEGVRLDECARSAGRFSPGKTCAEVECDGACCYENGDCDEVTSGECSLSHGTWQGMNAVCTPNPCPQPAGACCGHLTGVCSAVTEAECSLEHGAWLGFGSSCSDGVGVGEPDPGCKGACCDLETGVCTQEFEGVCVEFGRRWHGEGTDCGDFECEPAAGACCDVAGNCSSITKASCDGGDWLGVGTACETDGCEGACCNELTGECIQVIEAECLVGDQYRWHGIGSKCADVDCSPILGACCDDDAACELRTRAACIELGTFFDGTACGGSAGDGEPDTFCGGACCNRAAGTCEDGPMSRSACNGLGDGFTWGGRRSTCSTMTCERDQDLDGEPDETDNCISTPNPSQRDTGGTLTGGNSGDFCDPAPIECESRVPTGGTLLGGSDDACVTLFAADQEGLFASCETCTNMCWGGCRSRVSFVDLFNGEEITRTFHCCSSHIATVSCNCSDTECVCSSVDCEGSTRDDFLTACTGPE